MDFEEACDYVMNGGTFMTDINIAYVLQALSESDEAVEAIREHGTFILDSLFAEKMMDLVEAAIEERDSD